MAASMTENKNMTLVKQMSKEAGSWIFDVVKDANINNSDHKQFSVSKV
jgi:hypothetical protein